MSASFPIGQGYTASQWEAWFAAHPPKGMLTFQGTGPLAGKTWPQVYASLYAQGKATPDQVASAVIDIEALGAAGQGAADAAQGAANMTAASSTGISQGLSWQNSLMSFLGTLTSAGTWVRVAKVALGGVLLVVGLAHITGANNSVASAARNIKVLPV